MSLKYKILSSFISDDRQFYQVCWCKFQKFVNAYAMHKQALKKYYNKGWFVYIEQVRNVHLIN
jgi:hypothetical protein